MRDRAVGVEELAAVGERVRRDVDDAHDPEGHGRRPYLAQRSRRRPGRASRLRLPRLPPLPPLRGRLGPKPAASSSRSRPRPAPSLTASGALLGEHEGDADAAAPGARGAADAVDVVLGGAGEVVVDDVRDAVDVDAAGGDVGGDQRRAPCRSRSWRARARAGPGTCRRAWRRPSTRFLASRLASRSAPRLVRTKTSVRSASRRAGRRASRPCPRGRRAGSGARSCRSTRPSARARGGPASCV